VSQSVDLGQNNNPNTTPTKDYEKVRVVVYLCGVQRLARARVVTDWIQRQGQRALIPCVGSGQVETETETDKGTGVVT